MPARRIRQFLVTLIATIAATIPPHVIAQPNPIEALKTCALEQIPIERTKNKPKYNNVKKACEAEYDALMAAVHPNTVNAYKKLIKEDIEKELKKPK